MSDLEQPASTVDKYSVAFSTDDVQVSNWLLDRGADPNKRCILDLTPLPNAMTGASMSFIKTLFEERDADPTKGQLLHHTVVRRSDDAQELVRFLLEKGVPVNKIKYEDDKQSFETRESWGLGTPLHRAAELGELAIVRCQLDAGADLSTLDTREKKAICWARQSGHSDVEEVLRKAEKTFRSIT